jgi:hypothetical protein
MSFGKTGEENNSEVLIIKKKKENVLCQTYSTGYPVNKQKKRDELALFYWSVFKECVPNITLKIRLRKPLK